jgi:hypothetical protein
MAAETATTQICTQSEGGDSEGAANLAKRIFFTPVYILLAEKEI